MNYDTISPYIFTEELDDKFLSQLAKKQNALFWASVFAMGTGVDYHLITVPNQTVYFVVEPTNGEGCIPPEDFLELLIGYEQNKMHWGYAWTIKSMSHHWDDYMNMALPIGRTRDVKLYALEADLNKRQIKLVNKEEVWKLVNRLEF